MRANRKWLFIALGGLVVALAGAEAFYFFFGGGGGGSVQGYARVPTAQVVQATGVMQVGNRVVHLLGINVAREEPNCTINGGVVVHCTLIVASRIAELVAGHTIRCDIRRLGRDDRNWGLCRAVGEGAPPGNRIEDTINGQLLLSGWAQGVAAHGPEFAGLAARARANGAGMWPGSTLPNPNRSGTQVGGVEVNDGNTMEIRETRMRLYGIDAPDLDQECTLNGLPYACGLLAYLTLIEMTAGVQQALCHISLIEGDDRPYGKCGLPAPNFTDLTPTVPSFNERMVLSGWALADERFTKDYVKVQDEARQAKRGLWAGEFVVPADWRNGKR